VAFGIGGFGAERIAATPQIFQALSLSSAPPTPPVPPLGHPAPSGDLTQLAQAAFSAILEIHSNPTAAQGPVAFALTEPPASQTSDQALIDLTLAKTPVPAHSESPVAATVIPAIAHPALVSKIVSTVKSLAISAVYSSPVFSFSA
jgi:hypothetical protein